MMTYNPKFDPQVVVAVAVDLNAPAGSIAAPFKGGIARDIGLSVLPPPDFDLTGLVTESFVTKQKDPRKPDYAAEIRRIRFLARKESRKTTVFEDSEIKDFEKEVEKKRVADKLRAAQFRAVDAFAMGQTSSTDVDTFKRVVLLPGETILHELRTVAFHGLISHPDEPKVGPGVVLCTEMTRVVGDGKIYRLHFYCCDVDSSFDATQKFGGNSAGCCTRPSNAEQNIKLSHTVRGTFKSAFVLNNLMHVHSELQEVSNFASEIYAIDGGKKGCCGLVACMIFILKCCVKCPKCVYKYLAHCFCPGEFLWTGSAATDHESKLEQMLQQPWEAEEGNVQVQFPFEGFNTPMHNGVKKQAKVVRNAHTLHITMRNSATNQIEAGMAILSPDETLANIVQFESFLQALSVEDATKVASLNYQLHWESMGFQRMSGVGGMINAGVNTVFGSSGSNIKGIAGQALQCLWRLVASTWNLIARFLFCGHCRLKY
jgi:hypothetical protein